MIKSSAIILAGLLTAPLYAETITCPSPDQVISKRVTQTGVAFAHLWTYYDSTNDNEFMGFSKLATANQSQGMLLSDDGQDILCAYQGTDNNGQATDDGDGYTIKMTHHDSSQTCSFTQGDVQPETTIYWQSAPCDDEASCIKLGAEIPYTGMACKNTGTVNCEISCT